MSRGPKPKTVANGLKRPAGGAMWGGFSPPADLSDEARREFDRLVAALSGVGTLEATDPRLVVTAARLHALLELAFADVETEGLTMDSGNHTTMKHPMLSTINTLTMRLRGLWADMGLTPASAKLGTAKGKDEASPWAGLLGVTG